MARYIACAAALMPFIICILVGLVLFNLFIIHFSFLLCGFLQIFYHAYFQVYPHFAIFLVAVPIFLLKLDKNKETNENQATTKRNIRPRRSSPQKKPWHVMETKISNFLRWYRAMKCDAKTVAGWDFERIIPCHGVRLRYFKMLIWNCCVYLFILSLWLRISWHVRAFSISY